MNNQLINDQEARNKIRTGIGKNFFVEAGAGSGKTTSLVGRMVNMIKKGIPVDQICTITYTKAAANEFFKRFQKALSEENDEKCKEALKHIDLAFMGTIDSFCNMIISEHPSAMKVPSSVENTSKEEFINIYKNEFSKIRNGEYGKELQVLCSQYVLFNNYEEENFAYILNDLMNKRNSEFVYDEVSQEEIDNFLKNEGNETIKVLEYLTKHPELICPKDDETKHRKAYETLFSKINILKKPWRNIPSVIKALKDIEKLRLNLNVDLGSISGEATRIFIPNKEEKAKYLKINEEEFLYRKLIKLKFDVTMNFVSKSIPMIADKLREQGKLEFFDYILYLRNALKEDAVNGGQLIRHINNRHRYFLIDEFQDTNPIQIEIFFYLSSDNPKEDFKECLPRDGSLFIVGDPKQSIYRFNGADVSSYLRIKDIFEKLENGEVLELTNNFRSTIELKDWFNNCFKDVLVEDENQAGYTAIPKVDNDHKAETKESGRIFTGSYMYQSIYGSKKNPAPEGKDDPNCVKDIILSILNDKTLLIKDEKTKEYRNPIYKDFMLITPTKTKLGDYMLVFKANGIPFKIEGKALFNECPAFKLITKIFGAIANPSNNTRVFGVLESDYFNLDKKEINSLLNEQGVKLDLTIYQDNKQMKKLSDFLKTTGKYSISSLYEYIMDEFDVFRYAGSENLEYVYYGLELLRDKQISGEINNLQDAYTYLNSLLDDNTDVERCLALSRDENKVHLANAHKVKGLEAPIVILIAGKSSKKAPLNRVVREDTNKCYVFGIEKDSIPIINSVSYEEEKEKEVNARAAEMDRLLYVAATRARDVLIVNDAYTSGGKKSGSNVWSKAVEKITHDIYSNIEKNNEIIDKPTTIDIDELKVSNILDSSASKVSSYRIARPSKEVAHKLSEDYEPTHKEDAALKGTLAHRLMEVLVLSRNNINLENAVRSIIDEYCDDDTYYEGLLNLGESIRNGGFIQNNDCPQDILNELLSANEVYTEVPFSYMENKEIWNGVIDVIYRKGDKWFIVDYKTNADPSDLDEKYKAQLEAYTKAFKETSGLDADALIYHLEI